MIRFESDHDPELSAVILLGGRISANPDVTNQNKTKISTAASICDSVFGSYCYQISMMC